MDTKGNLQRQSGWDFFIKFANELKNSNRFFSELTYLELFDIIIKQSTCNIDSHKELYRGRINKKNDTTPYVGEKIGMPSYSKSTSHGRANPYGINYMYFAENPETVIAELRPNIDDIISVGKFKLKNTARVVKLNNVGSIGGAIGDKWDSLLVAVFMVSLSRSFSRPVAKRSIS